MGGKCTLKSNLHSWKQTSEEAPHPEDITSDCTKLVANRAAFLFFGNSCMWNGLPVTYAGRHQTRGPLTPSETCKGCWSVGGVKGVGKRKRREREDVQLMISIQSWLHHKRAVLHILKSINVCAFDFYIHTILFM